MVDGKPVHCRINSAKGDAMNLVPLLMLAVGFILMGGALVVFARIK